MLIAADTVDALDEPAFEIPDRHRRRATDQAVQRADIRLGNLTAANQRIVADS